LIAVVVSTDVVCCVFVLLSLLLLSLGLRLYGLGRGARRTLGRRWTLDGGVCTFVVCMVDALPSLQAVSMRLWLAVSAVRCGAVWCGAVRVGQCAGCVQPWEAAGSASEHITGQLSVCLSVYAAV